MKFVLPFQWMKREQLAVDYHYDFEATRKDDNII